MEKEIKIALGLVVVGASVYGAYLFLKKKNPNKEDKSEFRGGDALQFPYKSKLISSDGHWCKNAKGGGGYFSVNPCSKGDIEVFPKEVNFSGFNAQSMVTRYKTPNWTVG